MQSAYERKIAELRRIITRQEYELAEYKRKEIEWANEIKQLEAYIAELRFNHPL